MVAWGLEDGFFVVCFTSCFLAEALLWVSFDFDFVEDLALWVLADLPGGACLGRLVLGVSVFDSILAGLGFAESSPVDGSCNWLIAAGAG